jgi:uncharacterized phage protein (TIGR02220 family)
MPLSTQALYFHLGLNADDDGVVEAYVIMNQLGVTEDELRILVSKGFVTVLNEDLVSYINDWQENNKIRADRKIDSIYKPLLLKLLPEITTIAAKERADTGKKTGWTSNGQPMDNQWTAQVRLGKDRLGKDRLGKDRKDISAEETPARYPWTDVVDYLNEKTGGHYRHTDSNRRLIEPRLKEGFTLADCKQVIDNKVADWGSGEMATYLRPKTLFQASKFEGYLNEKPRVSAGGESYGGIDF